MKRALALATVTTLFGVAPDTGTCQSSNSPPFVPTLDLRTDGPLAYKRLSLHPDPLRYAETAQGSLAATVAGSLLFGAVGGLGGGLMGMMIGAGGAGEWDAFFGAALGFLGGAAIGSGWGAHVGNGLRGRLGLDVFGGIIGVGVGAFAAGNCMDGSGKLSWLAFIVPTVTLPVVFERLSAGANYRKRHVEMAAGPAPGGVALALRVSF